MITIEDIFDKLDGMKVIGLSELSDKGLAKKEWFRYPVSLFATLKAQESNDHKSKEAAAYVEKVNSLKNPEFLLTAKKGELNKLTNVCDGNVIAFSDGGKVIMDIKRPKKDDIVKGIWSIYDSYSDMADQMRIIKTAVNYLAIDQGWVQLNEYSEMYVIKDTQTAINNAIIDEITTFIANHGDALITAMALSATSHWVTNHTLGGRADGSLIFKSLEIAGISGLFKTGKITANLYTVFHPVDKRVVLASITRNISHLVCIYTYGCYLPKRMYADDSLQLRINSAPAGNKRIDLAIALVRYAASNKFISCADSYIYIPEVLEMRDRLADLGTLAHVGASYYTWKNFECADPSYENLSNDHVIEVIRDYGSILNAIAKVHTLNFSPIVKNILNSGINSDAVARAVAIVEARAKKAKEFLEAILAEEEKSDIDQEMIKKIYAMIKGIQSPKVEKDKKKVTKGVEAAKG